VRAQGPGRPLGRRLGRGGPPGHRRGAADEAAGGQGARGARGLGCLLARRLGRGARRETGDRPRAAPPAAGGRGTLGGRRALARRLGRGGPAGRPPQGSRRGRRRPGEGRDARGLGCTPERRPGRETRRVIGAEPRTASPAAGGRGTPRGPARARAVTRTGDPPRCWQEAAGGTVDGRGHATPHRTPGGRPLPPPSDPDGYPLDGRRGAAGGAAGGPALVIAGSRRAPRRTPSAGQAGRTRTGESTGGWRRPPPAPARAGAHSRRARAATRTDQGARAGRPCSSFFHLHFRRPRRRDASRLFLPSLSPRHTGARDSDACTNVQAAGPVHAIAS